MTTAIVTDAPRSERPLGPGDRLVPWARRRRATILRLAAMELRLLAPGCSAASGPRG